MIIIGKKRREFIGKMISDLGKATITVALASHFFKEFSFFLRITVIAIGIIFLICSVLIIPEEEEG